LVGSAKEPEAMEKDMIGLFRTNAISYAHLVTAFLPLVQAGKTKKITIMSTGMADVDLVRQHNVWMGVSYAVTKAALDMIIAKLSAELSEQGILVMGISPGFIITNEVDNRKSLLFLFPSPP
jgi:NAD(P)-dependent dehydrogenase (short-subunit alcohol dehydrogenase family)